MHPSEKDFFVQAVGDIERIVSGAIAALVIFAIVAVGVFIISQLLRVWQLSLLQSRLRRAKARGKAAVPDAWTASADRLTGPPPE